MQSILDQSTIGSSREGGGGGGGGGVVVEHSGTL